MAGQSNGATTQSTDSEIPVHFNWSANDQCLEWMATKLVEGLRAKRSGSSSESSNPFSAAIPMTIEPYLSWAEMSDDLSSADEPFPKLSYMAYRSMLCAARLSGYQLSTVPPAKLFPLLRECEARAQGEIAACGANITLDLLATKLDPGGDPLKYDQNTVSATAANTVESAMPICSDLITSFQCL